MTMGKFSSSPEDNRIYFKKLRNLFMEANKLNEIKPLSILSMGMSDDFAVAIEEGSNMVRIGRAIWGLDG